MTPGPLIAIPIRSGTIPSCDGSTWSYEIGFANNGRLKWKLWSDKRRVLAQIADRNDTVSDIITELHTIVEAKARN